MYEICTQSVYFYIRLFRVRSLSQLFILWNPRTEAIFHAKAERDLLVLDRRFFAKGQAFSPRASLNDWALNQTLPGHAVCGRNGFNCGQCVHSAGI